MIACFLRFGKATLEALDKSIKKTARIEQTKAYSPPEPPKAYTPYFAMTLSSFQLRLKTENLI